MDEIARVSQIREVGALSAWLLSLSPEDYRSTVLTLAGWCDVLDEQVPTPNGDDLRAFVEALGSSNEE